ncbi:MAG: hypothetical protein IJ764_07705 [Bacteroidales bacterium]|nr:hypothetical protein [Bacteroidales bacterium]
MLSFIRMSLMRLPINILCLSIVALLSVACSGSRSDEVVARVYGHKLYRSDLAEIVPAGLKGEDSILLVQNYVNQWIDEMVLVSKAEKNIKEDFSRQLAQYHNSLLIYAYEQRIVGQMIDTVVTDAEILQYYADHRDDFILKSPIVKSLYVKMNPEDGGFWRMAALMEQYDMNESAYMEVQRIISHGVIEYSFDNEDWIPLSRLRGKISDNVFSDPHYFRRSHFSRVWDSTGVSMVHFFEAKLIDEYTPVEMEYDNIKTIIINMRKMDLVNQMRQDLRRDAEKRGAVYVM